MADVDGQADQIKNSDSISAIPLLFDTAGRFTGLLNLHTFADIKAEEKQLHYIRRVP